MRSVLPLLALTALVACGDPATTTAPSATAAKSASPAQTAAAPAATSGTTATAAATATAAPAAAFEPSAEPELAEWGKVREIKVPGSGPNSCETKLVREWLRVMCVPRSTELGKPVRIEVTAGRAPNERSRGENLKAVNDITTLVVPVRPGTTISATFTWENGAHELVANWPAGEPESARTIAFDNGEAPPSDAAPAASGAAPPPPMDTAPAVVKAEPPIDDAPGLADPPDDDAWSKAAEVGVKGSSALGCETKVLGDWFRARCEAADEAKAAKEIVVVKGRRKTQTRTKVEGKVAEIVTPYVEVTELHARFAFPDGAQFLVLRWPKGPKPRVAGAFETGAGSK